MNTSSHYRLRHFIPWTRRKIYLMFAISTTATLLFYFFKWTWLAIPWVPVALVGTAAAFIAGFRNTQTYNRIWEARQVWGSIVNNSRTWGIMMRDLVGTGDSREENELRRHLFLRNFAWLTALRFQLREHRPWEHVKTKPYNREYLKYYRVPEWEADISIYINLETNERKNLLKEMS